MLLELITRCLCAVVTLVLLFVMFDAVMRTGQGRSTHVGAWRWHLAVKTC